MQISGLFYFLHSINVAWLIKARKAADSSDCQLTVNLLPDTNRSMDTSDIRRDFLNQFQLADHIISDGSNVSGVSLPVSEKESNNIISNWCKPTLGKNIFCDESSLESLNVSRHKNIVTTNGCFDILHPGHLETLKFAASCGDELFVLINSDSSVKRFKGDSRPIHSQEFRARVLQQLPYVDYVVVFHEDNPLNLLDQIRPTVHVKGGSFIPERVKQESDLLAGWGGVLQPYELVGNYSTTNLLKQFPEKPFPV